jgi:Domain of unknown function (DUF4333)
VSGRRAVRSLAAGALMLPALAGCGASASTSDLDIARVQRAISQSVRSQRGILARVSCPRQVPQRSGALFGCMAQMPGGQTMFAVRQRDSHGDVSYLGCAGSFRSCAGIGAVRVLDSARVQAAIAASIGARRGLHAHVICPTGLPQSAGFQFVCLARYPGGSTPFEVRETGAGGQVSYLGL